MQRLIIQFGNPIRATVDCVQQKILYVTFTNIPCTVTLSHIKQNH